MGLRLRLKASVDISGYPRGDRIILQALKTYGMIVADNGSPWYLSGVPSSKWNNDQLHELDGIVGSDFEVVDESCLEVAPNSSLADLARCAHGATSRTGGAGDPRRRAPAVIPVMPVHVAPVSRARAVGSLRR